MARIHLNIFDTIDPRLGRHVEHDERSWNYRLLPKEARPRGVTTFWPSRVPPLNQGSLGACTGNAAAQWLNTDYAAARATAWRAETEADAIHFYSLATQLDGIPGVYPPTDSGSTGNAAAKALVQLRLIFSYSWVFSFTSTQAAVEMTPVMFGTRWTNTMYDPVNGLVKVGSLADSNVVGGHEFLGVGIDYQQKLILCRNSWGDQNAWTGCKPGGYFAIGYTKTHNYDFERLLEAEGDVTIPKLN